MRTMTRQLIEDMRDLRRQVTAERSYHYVGTILIKAIAEIERYDRNLKSRDDFIVSKDLWSEFVESLPR